MKNLLSKQVPILKLNKIQTILVNTEMISKILMDFSTRSICKIRDLVRAEERTKVTL